MPQDPFVGRWTLNPSQSEFDVNHRPRNATMSWEMDSDGAYVMRAEGTDDNGRLVVERPQRLIPDGGSHPVPDVPGLAAVTSRPDPNTLQMDVRREDGSLAGQATFVVSPDGRTLAATNTGFDSELRQYRQYTVWDRQ